MGFFVFLRSICVALVAGLFLLTTTRSPQARRSTRAFSAIAAFDGRTAALRMKWTRP